MLDVKILMHLTLLSSSLRTIDTHERYKFAESLCPLSVCLLTRNPNVQLFQIRKSEKVRADFLVERLECASQLRKFAAPQPSKMIRIENQIRKIENLELWHLVKRQQ